jgi:hypothetical protein
MAPRQKVVSVTAQHGKIQYREIKINGCGF